jgi:hypothetical protein
MKCAVQSWSIPISFAVAMVMGASDAHALYEHGAPICSARVTQGDREAALQCAHWSIECGKRFVRESGTDRYEVDVNRCIAINTAGFMHQKYGTNPDPFYQPPPVAAPYGKSICATLHQQYPNMPLRNCN